MSRAAGQRCSSGLHAASEADLAATVDALRDLDIVNEVAAVMRVEGENERPRLAGIIEEYREHLPSVPRPGHHPARGRNPLVRANRSAR